RPAGKAAVSQQRRTGSQTHRFEIRGGIQHLLHARAAFGAFVANDHNVPCLDFAAKNAFDGGVLALVDFCRTGEGQDAFVDTGGLDNTAIGRKIAVQHSQPAVLRIGVLARTNATALAIEVERVEIFILTERDLRRYTAGSRLIEIKDLFACMPAVDVPLIDGLTQRTCMHIANVQIEQPGPGQLAQDAEDAACAVDVFHMVFFGSRSYLAKTGYAPRDTVDISHGEIDFGLLCRCKQEIGRASW